MTSRHSGCLVMGFLIAMSGCSRADKQPDEEKPSASEEKPEAKKKKKKKTDDDTTDEDEGEKKPKKKSADEDPPVAKDDPKPIAPPKEDPPAAPPPKTATTPPPTVAPAANACAAPKTAVWIGDPNHPSCVKTCTHDTDCGAGHACTGKASVGAAAAPKAVAFCVDLPAVPSPSAAACPAGEIRWQDGKCYHQCATNKDCGTKVCTPFGGGKSGCI